TWYSITDQVDWDIALREEHGNVNPLGLFDLNRKIRAVGKCYKQLIADWREVLPTQSVCLRVAIALLSPNDDAKVREWQEEFNRVDERPKTAAAVSDRTP